MNAIVEIRAEQHFQDHDGWVSINKACVVGAKRGIVVEIEMVATLHPKLNVL